YHTCSHHKVGPTVTQVTAPVNHGEGPHWDAETGVLFFVDIASELVNKYDPATNEVTHAQFVGGGVTLVIPVKGTKTQQLLTTRGHDVILVNWNQQNATFDSTTNVNNVTVIATVETEANKSGNRWNDGKADVNGRLWAAETIGMLRQAFNNDALGKSQVYEWFSHFKSGKISTEDMPRPGCSSTGRNDENIAKMKRALDEDRRKTIDEVSEQTNLVKCTKFVPRLLRDDQRENRVRVCRDLKSEVQNDPNFLKRIVTGDESWCYGYEPESKQASSQWKTQNSPRPKKARQVRSNVETMSICTMGPEPIVGQVTPDQGAFYLLKPDTKPITEVTPVSISNGLAWNRDNTLLYYIDTATDQVDVFDFNLEQATISNRRKVFNLQENGVAGHPDGMTIDSNENLWIACFDGGQVINVNPYSGELIQSVPIPASRVTSAMFGGPHLDTLYVTTSRLGLSDEEQQQQPLAGSVFAITGLGVSALAPANNALPNLGKHK
ncbi:hypothetical protein ANN_01452, partial [Periplaneta americana]